MDTGSNRVIKGMEEWKEKEQRIADLFSPSAVRSRYVQQLKLEHMHDLRSKLGSDASKDERIMLRVLGGEISAMEKRLYPSPIIRYAVRLVRTVKEVFKSFEKKGNDQQATDRIKIPGAIDEFGHLNRASVKVQQKTNLRPTLVQKKRVSIKKGLKIK
jgi:hypothetical protein